MSKLQIPQHVKFKLEVWRDIGDTEVTGFFITEKDKPLKVIDAILVESKCSSVEVDISAESLEDMYLEQMKKGIFPAQLLIWWHTHPGNGAGPSITDESTFEDFGKDRTFNAMYILASGGDDFAQISVTDLTTGIMLSKPIKIKYVHEAWTEDICYDDLKADYDEKITVKIFSYLTHNNIHNSYSRFLPNSSRSPKKSASIGNGFTIFEDEHEPSFLEEEFMDDLFDAVSNREMTEVDADLFAKQEGYPGFDYEEYMKTYYGFGTDEVVNIDSDKEDIKNAAA